MSKEKGYLRKTFTTLGASNHALEERQVNDYYATEPKATKLLLEVERFNRNILEPACGGGDMSEVLKCNGYNVLSSDLFDRGYGTQKDFYSYKEWDGDIITNPPYKYALQFAQHALQIVKEGAKVAMFNRLLFLEGKARQTFFKENPPKTIYVASGRLFCAKNGDFETYNSKAVCYAWFVWEKGFKGDPIIKWIN